MIWVYLMMEVLYSFALPIGSCLLRLNFHLTGYDAQRSTTHLDALNESVRDEYTRTLRLYGRVFIMARAIWLMLVEWRGSGLCYFLVGFTKLYVVFDWTKNALILRMPNALIGYIMAAHQLTMAKFATLYLCLLVLIIPLRTSVT